MSVGPAALAASLLALLPTAAAALDRPFFQAALGPTSFQAVIGPRRTHLIYGLRAGANLAPRLGLETSLFFAGESGGPPAARVETEWRLLDLRLAGHLPLGRGFEVGAAAGPLIDLGSTRLVVADGPPVESQSLHASPGASASLFLRWRAGLFEARADLGAWLRAGRVEWWNSWSVGVVL